MGDEICDLKKYKSEHTWENLDGQKSLEFPPLNIFFFMELSKVHQPKQPLEEFSYIYKIVLFEAKILKTRRNSNIFTSSHIYEHINILLYGIFSIFNGFILSPPPLCRWFMGFCIKFLSLPPPLRNVKWYFLKEIPLWYELLWKKNTSLYYNQIEPFF